MPTAAEVNQLLQKYVPELIDCDPRYKYPMTENVWCNPVKSATGPNGEPCFVKGSADQGLRRNYVYATGPLGKGFYLLLCRNAYHHLYHRISSEMPSMCSCSKAGRKEYSDFYDAKQIIYNRSVGSRPDDEQCRKDALAIARGTAVAYYHYDQNYQLVVGTATLAATI